MTTTKRGRKKKAEVPKVDISEIYDALDKDLGKIVVLNDNHNTFEWVIATFMEVLQHNYFQAEQCAMIIHNKGKCSVKEGIREKLIPLKDEIRRRGLRAIID